jgi:predicted regulator of Ras-like GTPase activity (Roadblock/LC7/MglB family)
MVGSAPVDATQAIADLTEISSQIELVVLLDGAGAVLGSNADDDARAGRLAAGAAQLLEEAVAAVERDEAPAQLEAATPEGSVFVVREGDHTVVATTGPDPTVGLVFYDLKSALRGLDPPEKPKRAPRRKQEAAGGAA